MAKHHSAHHTGKMKAGSHLKPHTGKDKMAHSTHHTNHGEHGMGFGIMHAAPHPEEGTGGCFTDDDNVHEED